MLAMENIFKEQPIEVMIGEAPDATREQDDDDGPLESPIYRTAYGPIL